MTAREYMARKLHEFRNAANLSVDTVGERLGKSPKTISAWEVGRGQPDADNLVRLCVLYHVNISDFYSEDVSGEDVMTDEENDILMVYKSLSENDKAVARRVLESLAGL